MFIFDGQKPLGARYMYLLFYPLRQILSVRYSSHHVRSYHSLCPIQCVHVIATGASHMVYHVIPGMALRSVSCDPLCGVSCDPLCGESCDPLA